MKKAMSRALAGALLAAAAAANAQDLGSGLHFVVTGGLTGGGETLATAHYTNGDTERIKSGGLVEIGGGMLWQFPSMPLALQATINYHVHDASARNGKLKFERIPLESILYYTGVQKWRFGTGLRVVQSPKYTAHVDGYTDESMDFKDATGAIIEVGYAVSPKSWVNFRYVAEKYQPETYHLGSASLNMSNAASVNGNHFGVNFTYAF